MLPIKRPRPAKRKPLPCLDKISAMICVDPSFLHVTQLPNPVPVARKGALVFNQGLHLKGSALNNFFPRRNFLQTATVAAAGLVLSPESALAAQSETGPRSLPEPIARLKARKAEA